MKKCCNWKENKQQITIDCSNTSSIVFFFQWDNVVSIIAKKKHEPENLTRSEKQFPYMEHDNMAYKNGIYIGLWMHCVNVYVF